MRYLFDCWDRFCSRIEKFCSVYLFLDYDGTLAPIVSRPELAILSPSVRELIKKIKRSGRFKVAVISGRALEDVKKMVGVRGITYAGNHGFEIEESSGKVVKFYIRGINTILKKIGLRLKRELEGIGGVKVEYKGYTLSVHFRLVKPGRRALVKKIFARIVRPYCLAKKLKSSRGKMVLELRPAIEWDKGKAVLRILSAQKDAFPVYVGDDTTDRDAFYAIRNRGISVFVGRPGRGMRADYFLKDTKEVGEFLWRLTQQC